MKNNVKQFRKSRGLTQKELGELLCVSRQTIISIESNRYIPSTILSLKIAKFLEKKVEELFILEKDDMNSN